MTFARVVAAAFVGAALLAGPALADLAETAKAAGKDASWLFIQTAESVKFDGTTLTWIDAVNLPSRYYGSLGVPRRARQRTVGVT